MCLAVPIHAFSAEERMAGRVSLGLGVAAALLATGYTFGVRPKMLRWGATDDELREEFPGADIIPGASRSATMAVTIDAPPSAVWPWLVQMGVERGGWYSWDRLDNFGRRSAESIHPEWQDIAVGDHLVATPDGNEWWEVAALDPNRFLCLRMSLDLKGREFDPRGKRPRFFTDSTWGFELKELPDARTRLVVSGYWLFRPKFLQPLLNVLVLEPSHWVMQTRQFTNLKRLAERAATPVANVVLSSP
jgi:proline iminopeptidase